MILDGFSWNLLAAAVGVALLHTLLGPDHYLPFLMLSRAGAWSRPRTLLITAACGVAHVISSLILGGVGILFGVAVGRLEAVENFRGGLAAWALVGLGLAYAVWGTRRAIRRQRGLRPHIHPEGSPLPHLHSGGDQAHHHSDGSQGSRTTFWTLFTIFILGPCEPLIPLFVLPASRGAWGLALSTAAIFGVITVATMVFATHLTLTGLTWLRLGPLERWSQALAGILIAVTGLAVIGLGL